MDGGQHATSGGEPRTPGNVDDFKIKGAAARLAPTHQKPLEDCIICLQPVTERAVAVPCNHLSFDFICLVSWLQQRQTCPLCNVPVSLVQFDWRSPTDYKSFQVRSPPSGKRRDEDEGLPNARRNPLRRRDADSLPSGDPALEIRKRVYQQELYSLHIGANRISGHHDFTPADFTSSQLLQRRARTFLRRELHVFSYLHSQGGVRNVDFVLEYIIAMLKKFDPKAADGRAVDLLSEFINRASARLLLHELLAWLRSPHGTLVEWDRSVQYPPILERSSLKGLG